MEPDFSGYVTRYNTKCNDGRTIAHAAFAHQDGTKVPLVYQHNHTDVSQVLGHAILSKREDGIWGDVFLNGNDKAIDCKRAVDHKDLDKFSIWAKDLDQRGYLVHDGVIQEVSVVLAGSNSGAEIYNVLQHGNMDPDDMLMVVTGDIELKHSATDDDPKKPDEAKPDVKPDDAPPQETDKPSEDGKKVGDVLETLSDEQKIAVNSLIDDVVTEAVTEGITKALAEEPALQHSSIDSSKEGPKMTRNLFDETKQQNGTPNLPQLKHDDLQAVLATAKGAQGDNPFNADRATTSLRGLIRSDKGKELLHADELMHADYGLENLEILFPDAAAKMATPHFIDRRQEWVKVFISGTSHTPFSRVKTLYADITAEEARARGYIKAHQKTDEVFPVFKRETGPAWIIKKQRLDRQDIIDIKDFDVVAWIKVEMRGKLDEEIARAALFSDGRPTMVGGEMNPDKIQEPTGTSGNGIRSVLNDDDLYSTSYYVPLADDASGTDYNVVLDTVTEAKEFYMGSGNVTSFMSYRLATRLLTIRDDFGHRVYRNLSEVAGDMDVSKIVRVPTELMPAGVLCINLDLSDYNFGTDRGGEITLFDDFDINFNQFHYLMETYLSGALVLPYAAQIFRQIDPATNILVEDITAPVKADNVVTVPTQTGVQYRRVDTGNVVAGGATITLDDTTLKTVTLEAEPTAGYYFDTDADVKDNFTFRYSQPAS